MYVYICIHEYVTKTQVFTQSHLNQKQTNTCLYIYILFQFYTSGSCSACNVQYVFICAYSV